MSGNVIHLRAAPQSGDSAYRRFCLARREMNRTFIEWLSERPPTADVQVEVDAVTHALAQLRDVLLP